MLRYNQPCILWKYEEVIPKYQTSQFKQYVIPAPPHLSLVSCIFYLSLIQTTISTRYLLYLVLSPYDNLFVVICYLVGTKTDLGANRVVSIDAAKELAQSRGMPFFETRYIYIYSLYPSSTHPCSSIFSSMILLVSSIPHLLPL